MTYEEAVKVASLISTADGGCSECVCTLLSGLMDEFPSVDWDRAFVEGASRESYWKPEQMVIEARAVATSKSVVQQESNDG